MRKTFYRCDKWIPCDTPEGKQSHRCILELVHTGNCTARTPTGTIFGKGYCPGDEPRPDALPLAQVVMTTPGMWTVELWSEPGRCYIPAGYITESYLPYAEWADGMPLRDGFRAILLNQKWTHARHYAEFNAARDWIIQENPFGIAPF